MLPLDSPRWSKLPSSVGNGVEPASELARLKPLLLNTEGPAFSQAIEELGYVVEDLDHQQTTYAATMAAMPHFVEIAMGLPLNSQIQLLSWIAMMHHDAAGVRSKEEDLLLWYRESIAQAKNLNKSILTGHAKLSFGDQISLFESYQQFNGEYHYAFRDHQWLEYKCPACEEALIAALHDSEYWVWQAADGDDFEAVATANKVQVKPAANIETKIELPENLELKPILAIAQQGNRQETIAWLERLTGTSPCPACDQEIRVAYNEFWFKNS